MGRYANIRGHLMASFQSEMSSATRRCAIHNGGYGCISTDDRMGGASARLVVAEWSLSSDECELRYIYNTWVLAKPVEELDHTGL